MLLSSTINRQLTQASSCSWRAPRSSIRISSPVTFGRRIIAPQLDKFINAYPEVKIELLLDDRPTDFATDQVDVAFRNGRVTDSQVIAKQVPMRMATIASPSYIAANGLPDTPEDMIHHKCINYRYWNGLGLEWEFRADGLTRKLLPGAHLTFNNFDLVLRAVLQGRGIAHLPGYLIRPYVQARELVVALPEYAPEDRGHYLCYLSRQHMPSRVRVFIDFMTEEVRALHLDNFDDCGDDIHGICQSAH